MLDAGWQLAPEAAFTKQKLSFSTLNIKEAGYVFVYLSHDDASNNWVYFDDLKITYTRTNVIQYNEYYPFGLQTNASWTRDNSTNNFLYNAGSELNQASGWYETFYRGYDAALGRFLQVDPMAASQGMFTPYHYAANNPVAYNDPNGDKYMKIEAPAFSPENNDAWSRASGGGGNGPGSGNYWADGIFNDDWTSSNGSESFKALADAYRSGADLELVGSVWYAKDKDGDKVPMTARNGEIGYWKENLNVYYDEGVVVESGAEFVSLQAQQGGPETWYYMLKTEGGPHGLVYDPNTNTVYDANHPNEGRTNGLISWLTGNAKSMGYKFNMSNPKDVKRFWEFGGGRGELMLAPITITDPAAARAFFESNTGKEWDYNFFTNNCKHYSCQGFEAGGANIPTMGPAPQIWVGSLFIGRWNSSMATPYIMNGVK